MSDRTGPEPKECAICHKVGMPPEVMPYYVGFVKQKASHKWCHQTCVHDVMAAKRAEQGPLFPVEHESNDGQ